MELLHLRSNRDQAVFIYLCFNESTTKTYGLKSEKVPEEEAQKIKRAHNSLKNLNKEKHITWLKENAPIAYKQAYRELDLASYTLLGRYQIG
jgi:hypothetical protein